LAGPETHRKCPATEPLVPATAANDVASGLVITHDVLPLLVGDYTKVLEFEKGYGCAVEINGAGFESEDRAWEGTATFREASSRQTNPSPYPHIWAADPRRGDR
jgi:hypothetical protein